MIPYPTPTLPCPTLVPVTWRGAQHVADRAGRVGAGPEAGGARAHLPPRGGAAQGMSCAALWWTRGKPGCERVRDCGSGGLDVHSRS